LLSTPKKAAGAIGGLTNTSYAFLGLLAIRPATGYELAKQVKHGMGRFWPRTTSKLYEEPKKLARLGLVTASPGATGKRPKVTYALTEAGRAAFRAWLAQPSQDPALQAEHLMKVYFAEHGSRDDLLATLAGVRTWAETRGAEVMLTARAYQDGAGPQPGRMAQLVLVERLLIDLYEAIDDWSRWAAAVVQEWPEEATERAADSGALREAARRATHPEGPTRTSVPAPRLLLSEMPPLVEPDVFDSYL
jgi:DNA-binding PadR family transcriptional regulator